VRHGNNKLATEGVNGEVIFFISVSLHGYYVM